MLLHTSDVCYTENVSLHDKLLKGSSSPHGFDYGYLRKDIQCKTLHIARFRTSNPEKFSSIKAAAKAHKIYSIRNVISIGLALTPETNEHCAAFPKSHTCRGKRQPG